MRALRVGDLVLLREKQDDTFVKHHGAGIVTQVQKFNQEYKYPQAMTSRDIISVDFPRPFLYTCKVIRSSTWLTSPLT